jgi:hypothetical protein
VLSASAELGSAHKIKQTKGRGSKECFMVFAV